jgi:hypothetical protein
LVGALASGDTTAAYQLAESAVTLSSNSLETDGWNAVMDYLDSNNPADLYDAEQNFNLGGI